MLSCVSSWIRALQGLEPAETIARTQARVDAIRMLVAAGADPDREYDQKMIPGVPTVSARTIAEFSGYSDIIIRALDDAVKLAETPTTARAAPAEGGRVVEEKMREVREDASEDAPVQVSDRRVLLREDVPGGALARTQGGVSRGARGEEGEGIEASVL